MEKEPEPGEITTIAVPVGQLPSTAPPPPSNTPTEPAIPAGTIVIPGTEIP